MAVKTILLKGANYVRKEAIAASAITPGYLVERIAAGTLQAHSNASDNALPAFALENEVVGQNIDVDYATADTVLYGVFGAGCEINAVLAASAAAVIIGSFLESAGDGTLRIATADTATDTTQREGIIAVATEAVDNSGGGSEVRVIVEIL